MVITASNIAKTLIRMRMHGSGGLKKFTGNAKDRNVLISLVKDYVRQNPKFAKLMEVAGLNVVTVANMLYDRK